MAGRFSDEFIQRVQDANNLVDIIGQYTQLKPSGHQMMARCPFPDHPEKTPSFAVSPDKQVYHCFGCKKSGNVFRFLESYSGMSFREAVEYLARRASIPLPVEEAQGPRPRASSAGVTSAPAALEAGRNYKSILFRVNLAAANYFYQSLLSLAPDHPARVYAAKRGLTPALIQSFRLGYASPEWENLVLHLQRLKAPLKAAERLGLIKPKSKGKTSAGTTDHFDLFRERLMFPIFSPMGDVVGFGGRVLSPDAQPKYLNSPESPVFSKGRIFYGLHETAKHIRAQGSAVVVEGYMDFLALYAAGIPNVVATLGTALTPAHAKLLKRYTNTVVVLFDGDAAGQSAAERSLPVLLHEGLFVKALTLPDQADPDDYLHSHGTQALRDQLHAAPELFYLVLQAALRELGGHSSGKVQAIDKLAPILAVMHDRRLRDLYLAEMAERLQVEVPWLTRAISESAGRAGTGRKSEARSGQSASPSTPSVPTHFAPEAAAVSSTASGEACSAKIFRIETAHRTEICLLNLALKSEELLREIAGCGIVEQLQHIELKQVFERLLLMYRQEPGQFVKFASRLAQEVEPSSLVTLHLEPTFATGEAADDRKLLQDCCKSVQDRNLKAQAKALAFELKQHPSGDHLERLMNIQKHRLSIWKDQKKI